MASTAPTQQQTTSLKGSWEEMLTRAQRMAANRNDEAIPLYEKLVTRLSKMPEEQRQLNDSRLQKILMSATANAQSYLNLREQYDEALRIMDITRAVLVDEDARESFDQHRADILIIAGQREKAVEILRQMVEDHENKIEYLGVLFRLYTEAKEWEKAEGLLEEIKQQAETDAAEEGDATEATRISGYVDSCHALLALEKGEWQEATSWYEKMAQSGGDFRQNYQFLYIPLIHGGQYETALPFIQRDKTHKIRSAFWTGLAQHRLGNTSAAERAWNQAATTELTQEEARYLFEYVLSHYYLKDTKGEGLELVLRVIREAEAPSWSLFFLAGLGWAARGTMSNAHTNFALAVDQRRSLAQGRLLPEELAKFVQDLVAESNQTEFTKYFETA